MNCVSDRCTHNFVDSHQTDNWIMKPFPQNVWIKGGAYAIVEVLKYLGAHSQTQRIDIEDEFIL